MAAQSMSTRPVFAGDALNAGRRHAVALIEGREEPYAAAKAIWEAGFDGSFCEVAEETMRRAAAEWLEVADDEPKWRPYFDRWPYTELGYERPADDSSPEHG